LGDVQKLDDKKRDRILRVAAELFATRPFHKVLLDDLAVEAAVGKGTLYTYFESKEALHLAVLYYSFEKLVDRLKRCLQADATGSPREALETIVGELVQHGFQNPHLLELLRSLPIPETSTGQWLQKREELAGLIESVIRRGTGNGDFSDPHPELTARFVLGLVRAVFIDGVTELDATVVTRHILRFLESSLVSLPNPQLQS
jgi:AcrR family transcriptional regulator